MSRPSWDKYFLDIVDVVASRSSCGRRKVGCVLVNERKQIIATGYNGPARGLQNCTKASPCPGVFAKSGEGLASCVAVHAEQNALLFCSDVYNIDTVYVSCTPCKHCTKMLLNTGARRIVAHEHYPHEGAMKLWQREGRLLFIYNDAKTIDEWDGAAYE